MAYRKSVGDVRRFLERQPLCRGCTSYFTASLNRFSNPDMEVLASLFKNDSSVDEQDTGLVKKPGNSTKGPAVAMRLRRRLCGAKHLELRMQILDEYIYMVDLTGFWSPLLISLQKGVKHNIAIETFEFILDNYGKVQYLGSMSILCSRMISFAGTIGDQVLAQKWFDQMERKGIAITGAAYNALIHAYAKTGGTRKAFRIFEKMQHSADEFLQPNDVTFNTLIDMYGREGALDEMESMYASLVNAGFMPDVITHNARLSGYAKANRFDKMEQVYEEMKEQPCHMNIVTFNVLCTGHAMGNQIELMETSVERLEAAGYRMNTTIAREVIKAYARAGLIEKMENMMEKIYKNEGLICTTDANGMIIEAFMKAGRLDKAELHIDNVCCKENAVIPSYALETMISNLVEADDYERIASVYHRLRKCRNWRPGLRPGSTVFESFMSAFYKKKLFDKVDEIATDMAVDGIKCTSKILQMLYDVYQQTGQEGKLSLVENMMNEAGHKLELPKD